MPNWGIRRGIGGDFFVPDKIGRPEPGNIGALVTLDPTKEGGTATILPNASGGFLVSNGVKTKPSFQVPSGLNVQFNSIGVGRAANGTSGDVDAAGIYHTRSNSTTTPQFHFLAEASGALAYTGQGIGLDSNGAIAINAAGGGVYTMASGTKQNVLDDGSGNVKPAGSLFLVTGGLVYFDTGADASMNSDASGNIVITAKSGATTFLKSGSSIVFQVNSSGNAETTGTLQIGSRPAFVTGDKYLVVDSSGNVHVSSLGPVS